MGIRRSLALTALAGLAGCGTTARITGHDGAAYVGEITGGDAESVWLDVHGEQARVPRAAIADIDHPGNVMLVGGAVLGGWSALLLGAGLLGYSMHDGAADEPATFNGEPAGELALNGLIGTALGLVGVIWGHRIWSTSVENARAPDGPGVSIHVAPGGLLVRF